MHKKQVIQPEGAFENTRLHKNKHLFTDLHT